MNSLYLSVSCVLPTISKSWLLPGKCGLAGRGGAGCGGGGGRGWKAESCKMWFSSRSVAILWVLMDRFVLSIILKNKLVLIKPIKWP